MPETLTPGLALVINAPYEPTKALYIGAANLEHGVPITGSTVFNVGSVAKQITAHLAIVSADRWRQQLDTQVADLVPRVTFPIRLRDLITHTAGVRDAESLLSLVGLREHDHYTSDDLLGIAYRQRGPATPRGTFLYSNTGYLLLARALENTYSAPLQDIAQELLFHPLAMTDTRFKHDISEVIPNAASSYATTGAGGWQHCRRPSTIPGPGSLWSTTADLDKWLLHLHRRWQTTAMALPGEHDTAYVASDRAGHIYGPGLYVEAREPDRVFHHGHEQGFSASVSVDRSGFRVTCLSNSSTFKADHVAHRAIRARSTIDAVDVAITTPDTRPASTPEVTNIKPREADNHSWLGTYACSDLPGSVRLSLDGSTLCLWRRGTCDSLRPASDHGEFVGEGLSLYLTPGTDPTSTEVAAFTLSLDRAPNLAYEWIGP